MNARQKAQQQYTNDIISLLTNDNDDTNQELLALITDRYPDNDTEHTLAMIDTLHTLIKTTLTAHLNPHPIKKLQPKSRATRFEDAKALISDGKSQIEELRDELQSWRDNLPENLQGGQKADELDAAVSSLEDAIGQAEEIEGTDVEFPRAF